VKAAVLEEIGKLKVKAVKRPKCPPDGLLIKVAACAVCGTDVKVLHHGHHLIVFPRITGHELAGTIVEVGEEVIGYHVSRRVAVAPAIPCGQCYYCRRGLQGMCENLTAIGYHYDGGFAEYMAVPGVALKNGCVSSVPPGVSFDEATLAEPLACCINAQELMGVSLGDVVVIIGAGPIGCLNASLARARGAGRVILTDIKKERLKLAEKVAGADLYINLTGEELKERIFGETERRGADKVIVACSSAKAQEESLGLVARRGVVDFFGGLPKDEPYIKFNSNLLHYREFSVVGNHGSAPRHNVLALELIAQGQINVKDLITHRFTISNTLKGIETTEAAEGLKVIIEGEA
jgi:L-iditol 2-dehydrogenase